MPTLTPAITTDYERAGWFTAALILVSLVGDGFSGRPLGLRHQLILLPVTLAFIFTLYRLLARTSPPDTRAWTPRRALVLAFAFELVMVALFLYQCRHFAAMGYRLHPVVTAIVFGLFVLALAALAFSREASGYWIIGVSAAAYLGGIFLAISSFPLNYLRSDMLPVILWANTHLLQGISPYQTMYMGTRVYDFPYLPGMLMAYLPAVAAHVDLRFACAAYVLGTAAVIFFAARLDRRREVAALLALFLLCPFLQYRHELYNQPHWLPMAAAFVLMHKRRFVWAAFVLGLSMAIYQFSWIICPFVLLNAWRRRGWREAAKLTAAAAAGALLLAGPFLRSAYARIASNTVGQWGLREHAQADVINLSYWATFLITPAHLLRLQAVLMVLIFAYCVFNARCATLLDTLRWTIVALTVFILFNVLVDGYFYLMLLVPLLIYTCVANGWWREPDELARPA